MDEIKIGSNRSFGIVFFFVFLFIAVYPLIKNQDIRLWSLTVSVVFLTLGIFNSKILNPLNKLWFKIGICSFNFYKYFCINFIIAYAKKIERENA